jgi:hypothetical protein
MINTGDGTGAHSTALLVLFWKWPWAREMHVSGLSHHMRVSS